MEGGTDLVIDMGNPGLTLWVHSSWWRHDRCPQSAFRVLWNTCMFVLVKMLPFRVAPYLLCLALVCLASTTLAQETDIPLLLPNPNPNPNPNPIPNPNPNPNPNPTRPPIFDVSNFESTSAQVTGCPPDQVSFELVTGYVYSAPADMLDSQPGTLMLTDCIDMCRNNRSCMAVNYETGLCVLFSSNADMYPGCGWEVWVECENGRCGWRNGDVGGEMEMWVEKWRCGWRNGDVGGEMEVWVGLCVFGERDGGVQ
ncbi:hypothetical protein Pcinc_042891 [Petrolisthes cinctipes]|uniref:Apple domain-containing protein n=1 Tax=Petrolisthes cinctipes TaxID=88211 RepID=A0AAE1EID0_PETCI|nr:hypothetical protein Pcinc_042891 [Petrolisthes cinctipes]